MIDDQEMHPGYFVALEFLDKEIYNNLQHIHNNRYDLIDEAPIPPITKALNVRIEK
jgi:hypothetical protein